MSADENGCGRKYAFTSYTYDGNGNIISIQLPSGDEIHREYDLCDRITAEHYREKNGSIDNRITYHYDKNGNLTEVRYQDGHTITMCYDVMDRLVSRAEGRGTTRMTYDLDGKLISQINNSYSFEFDIRAVIEYKENYIVLLAIPFNKTEINNIYCLDAKARLIWQVEDLSVRYPELKKPLPYEQMGIKDDIIFASDFYGRNYQIKVNSGKIEGVKTFK